MFSRRVLRLVSLIGTLMVAACAAPLPASFPKESISVPDDVDHYATEPQPDGAVGGPGIDQVRAEIAAALAKRGDHAELDGSLGATASWALRGADESRPVDTVGSEAASRHFGFGGTFIGTAIEALYACGFDVLRTVAASRSCTRRIARPRRL